MNEQENPSMSETSEAEREHAMYVAVFQQNCENVRHIRNERLSFINIYAIITAAILSLLRSVKGEAFSELTLLLFLSFFSLLGLVSSLRLKAELEECLRDIEKLVKPVGLHDYMSLGLSRGPLVRYPKFRWIFPVFYAIANVGFLLLLGYRLMQFMGWR
jgi:hypothetical protein